MTRENPDAVQARRAGRAAFLGLRRGGVGPWAPGALDMAGAGLRQARLLRPSPNGRESWGGPGLACARRWPADCAHKM